MSHTKGVGTGVAVGTGEAVGSGVGGVMVGNGVGSPIHQQPVQSQLNCDSISAQV